MEPFRFSERRFLGQLAFRVAVAVSVVMLSLLASSGSSRAVVVTSTWVATNNTGFTVSDFEGTFAGSGGSLANIDIIHNGGPGTINMEIATGNTVSILWNSPYLANGNSVAFTIDSDFPGIQFVGGFWTRSALHLGAITIPSGGISQTPLPQALFLFGTGLLGLGGLLRRVRPRQA
jgi:hypothetical protein